MSVFVKLPEKMRVPLFIMHLSDGIFHDKPSSYWEIPYGFGIPISAGIPKVDDIWKMSHDWGCP